MDWPEAITTCVGIATAGAVIWKLLSVLGRSQARDDEEQ